MHDVCSHTAPQLASRRVALRVDVVREPVWAMVDGTKLRQVVINLMSNAIRLTERGYVRLRCEVVSREGDEVCVSVEVSDSGPGLPPERLARLTQRYGLSVGGSGLGLYLVQKLLESMGTELHATSPIVHESGGGRGEGGGDGGGSELGPGAAIRCTLRLRACAPPASAGAPSGGVHGDGNALPEQLRVLVADDLAINRRVLRFALRKVCAAWEVSEASSAEEALDLFERAADGGAPYGLICMDEIYDSGFGSTADRLTGTEAAQRMRARRPAHVGAREGEPAVAPRGSELHGA